ncbi:MAG: response regulator [Pseudomonadota bacterium]
MDAALKVMVVDDEARICGNVAKILSKSGFDVVTAQSAQEALEKMALGSYSLLISDIVMPGMNGLELLKLVKKDWPLTKAVMMTAYASTDTALKAIRMGALDYIPKPFTPDELRATVDMALSGQRAEVPVSDVERDAIDVIDLDIPFDHDEVADAVGEQYAGMIGPSDMPVVEVKARAPLEGFCEVGVMVCDIFKKLGATCKAGTKSGACPQLKKKGAQQGNSRPAFNAKRLIGIDQPFDYKEVAAVTGPEYIRNLHSDGVSVPYYEDLKTAVAKMDASPRRVIDVDVPFDHDEVAAATGETYARHIGPSDMPQVEITVAAPMEGFCEVGTMVCDIFKKLGATCKAGTKSGACPQLKKKTAKKSATADAFDGRRLLAPDLPFDVLEVAAIAGPGYVDHLVYEGTFQPSYEAVKANVARMDAEMSALQEAPAYPGLPAEPTTRNILVIDDEVAVNNNIRKVLSKNGYHIDQATTKTEALKHIAGHPYKVILLDLKIPGVQGLELLEAIRDRQPRAKVIVITGYASIETAVETARLGAIGYVAKPFTPDELRQATDYANRLAA